MIDPEVHEIISDAAHNFVADGDTACALANAVIGALATSGFVFVKVDAEVVQRVLAEMYKSADRK